MLEFTRPRPETDPAPDRPADRPATRLPTRPSPGSPGGLIVARTRLALLAVQRRRVIAVAIAGAVAVFTYEALSSAQRLTESLGTTQMVAVATSDLDAGSILTSDHLTLVERPVQFVPPDAVGESALGEVLVADVAEGEVIVGSRLGVAGSPLGPTERAVTVPLPLSPPLLDVGDHVDIVGLDVVDRPDAAAPIIGAQVITSGRVLAVNDAAVTVAADAYMALEVLRFVATGSVELLVRPGR